jgi:hypothetical protein
MKYFGLHPIKVEGSNFETGYGYSRFIKLKINSKKYYPILSARANTFGVKQQDRVKEKVFCSIEEKEDHLRFFAKSGEVEAPRWICGTPTLIIGNGIWGPKNNFELGQVESYKNLKASTIWEFNPKRGHGDFAFDIWFTKKKDQSINSEEKDLEIMVVLDNNFNFPWKQIDETEDFIIKHENKNENRLASDKGHCVAFILKKKTKKFDVNITELISSCKKYLRINFENYYIRSIDIINEFAKNSEIETKLYNLDFKFEKRNKK